MPIGKAMEMGAMALFGEKYGDEVRVVRFGESVELCGGTHVSHTGDIGLFKIVSEGAIAAGVRRIEAITSEKAQQYFFDLERLIQEIKGIFKNSKDVVKSIKDLMAEKETLDKRLSEIVKQRVAAMKTDLLLRTETINNIKFISADVSLDAGTVKDLAFRMSKELDEFVLVFGHNDNGKPGLTVMVSESLVASRGLNAQTMIKTLAVEIDGGGGGQPHFATAGGKNPEGIPKALEKAREMMRSL
jgi:alanyl-tRNA synthetase